MLNFLIGVAVCLGILYVLTATPWGLWVCKWTAIIVGTCVAILIVVDLFAILIAHADLGFVVGFVVMITVSVAFLVFIKFFPTYPEPPLSMEFPPTVDDSSEAYFRVPSVRP